ncbi:phosphatidylinositol 3,4,5-trisphosphate 5-phosphatase 2B-like [Gastrophryne carolinensis]
MCECWYFSELSQTTAAQLLIHDGRDGAFLVRQSESVPGAYAICLLYHQQVHTYRILPEENGLLSVQSAQGVEVRRFSGLGELISAYRHRANGLVTALHYPVGRERLTKGEQTGGDLWKCSCSIGTTVADLKILLRPRGASDRTHNASQKDSPLVAELEKVCIRLDREMKVALNCLRTLAQLFGHLSTVVLPHHDQITVVDNLIQNMSDVLHLLSELENKVTKTFQECITVSPCSPTTQPAVCPGESGINSERPNRRSKQQHVKQNENIHLGRSNLNNISVFIGTWNMGGASPPRSLVSWLSAKKQGASADGAGAWEAHDLYMIGTQENPQADREWADYLGSNLSTIHNYKMVCTHSVGAIKLALMVKEEYEHLISHIQTSAVRTRIGNTLGIRGAVGVSFEFNGTSLGFVTCHLVSGVDKVQKRNQAYGEILNGLALGDETLRGFQLPLRLTHLFWAGDLNYKLDMPVQDVLQCVYSGQHQLLIPVDQLNQERERKKVFLGFREEPVTFPPTCRYERGSRTYDLQKAKISGTCLFAPSWSDRILWTSYPDTEVTCKSYDCTDDIVTSDHAPVFATFFIGLSCLPQKGSSYTFKFVNIEIIVKAVNHSRAYIEFNSLCLKDSPQSNVNSVHSTEGSSFLKLGWSEQDLPEITLAAGERFTGHLLLSIQPTDGGEPFGECCISVLSANGNPDHQFEVFLSHCGEETGYLRGRVAMTHHKEYKTERNLKYRRELEKGKIGFPTKKAYIPVSPGDPSSSHSSKRLARQRPATICCDSYSNAEYFLFEELSSPSTPTSPRPRSALVSTEQIVEPGEIICGSKFDVPSGSPKYRKNTSRPAVFSFTNNMASYGATGSQQRGSVSGFPATVAAAAQLESWKRNFRNASRWLQPGYNQ